MKPCAKCKAKPRRKNHAYCQKCGSEYIKKFRASRPKWEGKLMSRLKASRMLKHIKLLVTRGQLNHALEAIGENIRYVERVKNEQDKVKYLILPSE